VVILAIASLAACGKGGSSSSTPPIPSKLFVVDSGNDAIATFINSNPTGPGAVPVDRSITGSNTTLTGKTVPAMALDALGDRLYVSTEGAIIVFNNASTANGDVSPARTLATVAAGNFTSLYLDTAGDRLYVGDMAAGVKVFDSASNANLASPNRTLTGDFGTAFSIRGVAVDAARDILYVAVTTAAPSTAILVFDGAHTQDGTQTPNRTITFPPSSDFRIFLDATSDSLYVSDLGGGISVFNGAHALNGAAPVADRTVSLGGGAGLTALALDSVNDRLYAAAHSSLIVVPGASTASGSPPAGTFQLLAPLGGDVTAVAVKP
jgi:hypothetical protein